MEDITDSQHSQNIRRGLWFQATRDHIDEVLNSDGSGKIPQFNPPWREPLWILPALYHGSQQHVDLANRIVARYHDGAKISCKELGQSHGSDFGVFQSNTLAHCFHRFRKQVTPEAGKVMRFHIDMLCRAYQGSAQPDFKFHGANDNMPMMATKGLILGGEAVGNEKAVRHGVWNLQQFRRLLSRSAWASEFNSSTYSPITLADAAMIASFSNSSEIRRLAGEIEHRLWAELLLHYHPATMHQAGPQCRAYAIDYAGHNHALQMLFWLVFGPETTGRDLISSYFNPDGTEVIHFAGCYLQSVAEFCDMIDANFKVPADLAKLIVERKYPAVLRGRSECMGRYDGQSGAYHTETYMEEDFSLGTVNGPLCGGEQTASLYATYKLKPAVKTFRDAATLFHRYCTSNYEYGTMELSTDGKFKGEKFVSSQGWCYGLQKQNVGLLLCTPNLKNAPLDTDTLKLAVLFPAHYGKIARSIMGDGKVMDGAQGESVDAAPVSVEAGEVFIHIQPLLPTSLPRNAAMRLVRQNHYEVLELVNYEGPKRAFSRRELAMVLNGAVLTISAKSKHGSLEEFHRVMSKGLVTDYLCLAHRFLLFQRDDVEFEVVMTPDPFGVQTEGVDGRSVSRPVFESNQLDVSKLPFVTGLVERNFPLFPWGDSLEAHPYADSPWIIGSRGLPGEPAYSKRVEKLKHLQEGDRAPDK